MPRIDLKPHSAEFADKNRKGQEHPARFCEMPGCASEALHKAPKSRELNDYYYFCLEHVQAYNKAWDFFSGMSGDQIEEFLIRSFHGDRPTWKYGVNGDARRILEDRAWQAYHFSESEPDRGRSEKRKDYYYSVDKTSPEFQAMAILGIEPPLTLEEIKRKYKELVKLYHPDRNPGDKKAEETIKQVNMAYTILKLSYEKYEKLNK